MRYHHTVLVGYLHQRRSQGRYDLAPLSFLKAESDNPIRFRGPLLYHIEVSGARVWRFSRCGVCFCECRFGFHEYDRVLRFVEWSAEDVRFENNWWGFEWCEDRWNYSYIGDDTYMRAWNGLGGESSKLSDCGYSYCDVWFYDWGCYWAA